MAKTGYALALHSGSAFHLDSAFGRVVTQQVQPRIIISRIAGANWAIHSASSATAQSSENTLTRLFPRTCQAWHDVTRYARAPEVMMHRTPADRRRPGKGLLRLLHAVSLWRIPRSKRQS